MKMVPLVLLLITAYIQGAIAGEKTECRCTRLPKITTIGIDIVHWYMEEDVGRCKEICHGNNTSTEVKLPKDRLSRLLRAHANVKFRNRASISRNNVKGQNEADYSCNPTEIVSKSYPLIGGSKYSTVIRKCGYQHTSSACRRQPLYKTFFKGTTYRRRHDVGSCLGVCGIDGHECKAIDSMMVAIKGPNGDGELTVPIVKKCGCVNPECHRVAFREVFKRKTEKGWIQEEKDVGMCVGTGCPRVCERCLLGENMCDRFCIVYREGACIATDYTTEPVYSGNFKPKEIRVIEHCGCAE